MLNISLSVQTKFASGDRLAGGGFFEWAADTLNVREVRIILIRTAKGKDKTLNQARDQYKIAGQCKTVSHIRQPALL